MFSTLGANTPPDATTPETGGMIQKHKIKPTFNQCLNFIPPKNIKNLRSSDAFRGCKSGGLFH